MKVIINIDEKRFKDIHHIASVQLKRGHFMTTEQIIAYCSKPLPKGHGDLIDRDKLLEKLMESNMTENCIEEMVLARDRAIIRGQSIIIEGDKESD